MCLPRRLAPCLLLSAAFLLSACQRSDVPEYDWSAVSKALESSIDPTAESPLPGYSFALAVDGEIVFEQAGGNLTTASRVPIASATKAPTAAAILTLVQDGKLDLDQPIHEYLDGAWPTTGPMSLITTRMLLNHTSGLPFTINCLDQTGLETILECVRQISRLALEFTPGEQFLYSANGYQVAGLVAERISGLPWKEFFQTRLADRIGLVDYEYLGDGNPRLAGGAIASAADYLKIQQLVLDHGQAAGEQIFPGEIADLMKRDQIAGLPVDYTPIPEGAGLNGYSFGWWISDKALHAPSKGPELSDPGVFGTVPWMDFDKRYAAIILIQGDSEAGLRLFNALRPLILQQIDAPGSRQAVIDAAAAD